MSKETQEKNLMTNATETASGELNMVKNRKNDNGCCYKWWHNKNTMCFTIVGTIFLTGVTSLLTFLIVKMYMPSNTSIQNQTNSTAELFIPLTTQINQFEQATKVVKTGIDENEYENDLINGNKDTNLKTDESEEPTNGSENSNDESGEVRDGSEKDENRSNENKEPESVSNADKQENEVDESDISKESEEEETTITVVTTKTSTTSKLVGRWDLVDSVNFEEYMKEIGVNFLTRKIGASTKPVNIITKNGNDWILRTESTFKNSETKFTDGVEFNEETMDGRKVKSVIKSDGLNKLIQEQRDVKTGKVVSTITREVNDKDQLIITLIAGNVSSIRTYKRS